jgi:DNA-binding CsgD family transcriptional regulator
MPNTPSDIVAALYRAAAGEETWPEALRMVGDSVGGVFTLIGFVDKAAGRTNSITSEPFDPDRRSRYRNRYFDLNPRVEKSARTPVGEVFYDAAIGRDVELARHPYYAEYLAQRDFTNFISANLVNGPSRRVNLSVQRTRQRGHVDKADVEIFKTIVPHAIAAYGLWEQLGRLTAETRLMSEAIEVIAAGVFLLDAHDGLIFANAHGSECLGPSGPLQANGASITTADVDQRDAFAAMLAAAHATDIDELAAARPARLNVASQDGARFSVAVRPLPQAIRLDRPERTGVIVIVEPIRPLTTVDEITHVLRLTPAEGALALALADGQRLRDYAEQNNLSVEAARRQLSGLRAKLAAQSRAGAAAEAVRRFAPPQAETGAAQRPRKQEEEVEAWSKRFALTAAETRLARHLLNGGTPATYASDRNISPHTVRNQLRAIYAKTNTNRQVSLLQLLLRTAGKNP